MIRNDNSLNVLFLLLISVVMLNVVSCSKKTERNIYDQDSESGQTINNFTVVQTEKGKEQWKLEAQKAEVFEEKELCVVYKPKIEIYEKSKVVSFLTADKGIAYSNTGDIELEGNVEMVSFVDNVKVRTSKIKWIGSKRLIVSDEFIEEEKEDIIITGWGLEANADLSRILIKKDVKANAKGS